MSESVIHSVEGGVLTLTLSRPEARNALDADAYRALTEAVVTADRDAAVGAVIVTGAGGHFTAGNDLRDFQKPLPAAGDAPGIAFLRAISGFGKPLLAAVEGVAVGIGSTMLLHCDFAFAGEGARFRMPFVPLGLVPEGASTLLLPRLAGSKRASDLLLLGREFSAAEALEAGLLTGVVPAGSALARAREVAAQLRALPPDAVRTAKALLRRPDRAAVKEAIDHEMAEFRRRLGSAEAKAAFAAFFARRGK
ncbi:MAG TPA: enoyl-CoA hydratase-related protein [Anaeromyxobacteraceae bacterium]|nr:enoyl-CoA hydratase-related protein [Anaeromyxobacteraceae bacterium]